MLISHIVTHGFASVKSTKVPSVLGGNLSFVREMRVEIRLPNGENKKVARRIIAWRHRMK